tara:strand:- start:2347 stop:2772 length:426 start_codon:yes stop_codon:yes gene_type:complete
MDRQEYFELLNEKHDMQIEVLEEWKNKYVDWTFDIYESSDSRQIHVILEGGEKFPDWYDGIYIDEYEYAQKLTNIIQDLSGGETICWLVSDDIDELIDWEDMAEDLETIGSVEIHQHNPNKPEDFSDKSDDKPLKAPNWAE